MRPTAKWFTCEMWNSPQKTNSNLNHFSSETNIQDGNRVSQAGHWKEGRRPPVPHLPGNSQAAHLHVPRLPHHLLYMCAQDPDMPWVPGETSKSSKEVSFSFFLPYLFFNFSFYVLFYLPRHRFRSMSNVRAWRLHLLLLLSPPQVVEHW